MKSNFLNRGAITAGLLALLWSATALAQSAMQPTWVKDGVDWSQYTKYLVKPLVLDDVQLVPPPWAENPAEWKLEVQNPGMVQQLFDDAIRAAIARKPKGHDFDYSRQKADGQVSRHMSHTGG